MQMTPVQSSNIAAIGYDAEAQALEVHFKSGGRYRYSGVPQHVHQLLMESRSKGKAFSLLIVRNKAYPAEKLEAVS